MRCLCCNKNLNDYESTRRHAVTGDFLDICTGCLSEVQDMVSIPYTDRQDLAGCSDIDEGLDTSDDTGYNEYIRDNIEE
jgi:hypothetical protein